MSFDDIQDDFAQYSWLDREGIFDISMARILKEHGMDQRRLDIGFIMLSTHIFISQERMSVGVVR
jgi:hypothetical protein